ncbi:MAG: TadE/TadG family type IV pilus assembly protein [Gammaproteobacteria bacterium]
MSTSSSTSERGVAMVEFAIILPLLLIIFLGIAELGRALLFQHRLTSAVEAGARYAARATGAVNPATCGATGGAWTTAEATARQMVTFGQLSGGTEPVVPGLATDDVAVSLAQRTVTGIDDPVCVVRVFVSVQYQGIFGAQFIPLLDIPQPRLGATSEERYIGE